MVPASVAIRAASRRSIRRSTAHNTHGISATAQEKFGKLPVDSTGPDIASVAAPTNAANGDAQRRSHSHIPAASSGNGAATQRLKPGTSGRTSRTSVTGSRKN